MTAGNPIRIAKFVAEDFISKSKLERCVVQVTDIVEKLDYLIILNWNNWKW